MKIFSTFFSGANPSFTNELNLGSPSTFNKKVTLMALTILIIHSLSNIPGANGGPLTFAACVAGCEAQSAIATGPAATAAMSACMSGCTHLLADPSP